MRMNYQDLLSQRLIKRHRVNPAEIDELLRLSRRDLHVAAEVDNYDWAFAIAYNAILQATRALAFSRGYRPVGEAQHKTTVQILSIEFGSEPLVNEIERMRRKRHRVVYSMSGLISQVEAREAIRVAGEMVMQIHILLGREFPKASE